MPANSIEAIRQFVNGTTDPTLKERYFYALLNQIEQGRLFETPSVFDSQVKPGLTHLKTIIYAIKSLLGKIARTESVGVGLRLTELAMREAVLGEEPRITLSLTEGQLGIVSDADIVNSVQGQLSSDELFQELLDSNIIEVKLRL